MTDTASAQLELEHAAAVDQPVGDHHEAVIAEALGIIDGALGRVSGRDMVSSNEVADLLLDVRTLLRSSTEPAATR